MRRWRNSPQKKKNKQEVVLTGKDLINMDISSRISELEFNTMIIKIVAELKTSIEGTRESLTVT